MQMHKNKNNTNMDKQQTITELKEKMGLYVIAWDENNSNGFDNLLTEDIVFEVWQPENKELLYKIEGLGNLKKMHGAMIGGLFASGGVPRHNLSETIILEQKENTIKTKTPYYFAAFFKRNDASPLMITGTFNDTWVKTQNGWKVKERVILYDNLPDAILQQFKK